jgi:transglutaminase-like putative cysteine protease
MRLDIRYTTRFAYAEPVRESQNELRACPTSDDRQQLISYRVQTTPSSRVHSSVDYWGTRMDAFGIRVPHGSLEIVAEAVVETSPVQRILSSPRLADLADPEFREVHTEYLQPSPHTTWGEGVEREARKRAEAIGDDVVSLVLALHRAAGTSLRYAPGTTDVGVDIEEVLACGEGVCQDYAHLAVALCRAVGIPARYVSGYFFSVDDATGEEGTMDTVHVQTHAWMEAAIPGAGWWPLDTTNQAEVGERHVKIGHGRDYDDVPPLKGAFSGPGAHELSVDVQLRRYGADARQQQHHRPGAQAEQGQQQQ